PGPGDEKGRGHLWGATGGAHERGHPAGARLGRRSGLAGTCTVRADRPGGFLSREGRLHEGGEEGLPVLRGPSRVLGVRTGARRALRYLGGTLREGTAAAEESRRRGFRFPRGHALGSRTRRASRWLNRDARLLCVELFRTEVGFDFEGH